MNLVPRRLALPATLICLALQAAAAPAPATYTFDTTPRAGQHQRQRIDMQATIKMRAEAGPNATEAEREQIAQAAARLAQMGTLQMTMQMEQTLKVGQPDAQGWLPLNVAARFGSGQLTMGGQVQAMPQPAGGSLGFDARFNPRDFSFEVQRTEGSPELTALVSQQGSAMITEALQLAKALSQRPLKVGDSVDVPLAMNLPMPLPGGAGGMKGLVHYRLVRVDKGVAYFDLGMDLDMALDMPVPAKGAGATGAASAPEAGASAPEAAAPPAALHLVARGSGSGKSALRLADRLPLSQQLDMDLQMQMDMPDHGVMHMDMGMSMKSRGESLARPAVATKPALPASAARN